MYRNNKPLYILYIPEEILRIYLSIFRFYEFLLFWKFNTWMVLAELNVNKYDEKQFRGIYLHSSSIFDEEI